MIIIEGNTNKKIEDKYQLATRSEHYEYIKQIMVNKDRSGLSKAALETLAIIAYKQPVQEWKSKA